MSEPDIQAVNQDFIRYNQVEKSHTYRLAESESDEFDTDCRIRSFDFGKYLHGDDYAVEAPLKGT